VLVAAVLRLFRIGHASLWVDEVFTWHRAAIGGRPGLAEFLEDVHGPLHSLLLHLWGSVAGDSELALRLPSALFGIAMVPAGAWAAARWLGPAAAVPTAWLMAGSPFLVWYGQEARNYSLVMLCAVVSSGILAGVRERLRAGSVLAYLIAAAAGTLSNFSFLLLGPLHVRWWLGAPGRRLRRLVLGLLLLGVLVMLLAPWFPAASTQWDWRRLGASAEPASAAPLRGASTFHLAAVPFALHSFAVGYTLGPPLRALRAESSWRALRPYLGELVAVALVFGTLGVLGLREARRRGRLLDALLWIAIPFAIVSWFALRNFKVFHPRYVAVAAPGFLILLAAGFLGLKPRARVVMAVAVTALWALALGRHWFDPRYGKEDMRGAIAVVSQRARAGEKILAVNAWDPLVYYYRGPLPVERFWLGFAAQPGRLVPKLAAALDSQGTWVVLTRPEDLDPRGAFVELMDRSPNAEAFTFEGVRVWHVPAGTTVNP
jgi:4-amino-4-deoxy-L-arabinose transferase-like glycosyltransferase